MSLGARFEGGGGRRHWADVPGSAIERFAPYSLSLSLSLSLHSLSNPLSFLFHYRLQFSLSHPLRSYTCHLIRSLFFPLWSCIYYLIRALPLFLSLQSYNILFLFSLPLIVILYTYPIIRALSLLSVVSSSSHFFYFAKY